MVAIGGQFAWVNRSVFHSYPEEDKNPLEYFVSHTHKNPSLGLKWPTVLCKIIWIKLSRNYWETINEENLVI